MNAMVPSMCSEIYSLKENYDICFFHLLRLHHSALANMPIIFFQIVVQQWTAETARMSQRDLAFTSGLLAARTFNFP